MSIFYNADGSVELTDDLDASRQNLIPASAGVADQHAAIEAFFAEDNTVAAVPSTISDRQFFQQLAVQGIITQDEAIAAVSTGTIPSEMAPLIAGLPASQQFAAKMMLSGATQFDRSAPLTLAIGQAYGWTSAQLDALWLAASAL